MKVIAPFQSEAPQVLRQPLRAVALLCVCVALLGVASGCSDDGGSGDSIQTRDSGRLLAQPLSVAFAQLAVGESATREVVLTNIHDSQPLTIFDVELSARAGGTIEDLRLLNKPGENFVLRARETLTLQVEFVAAGRANAGVIKVVSSDPSYSRDAPLTIEVNTQANRPRIGFSPETVNFPRLPPGQSSEQPLEIRNFGSAPLVIYDVSYTGGTAFQVDELSNQQITLEPYDALLAAQQPEKYRLSVRVRYRASDTGGDRGTIRVESNDVSGQPAGAMRGAHSVAVQANADAPCILVDGTTRNFGAVPIGAVQPEVILVTNCGAQPLVVSGIELRENSDDGVFALDLGSWATHADGSLRGDITIAAGGSETFRVTYGPLHLRNDVGKVVILSNDPSRQELGIDLVGRGSDSVCPEARVGAMVRGVQTSPRPTIGAAPLDYIVLDGSASSDPDGQVVDYEWSVLQVPDGTVARLGPVSGDTHDSDRSRREFRALLAGTYKFGLVVIDNEGTRSCNQAVATVEAIPNKRVHIELTWTNPEDPDETDMNGSDLDLHLVKMGPGKWFESPYDIYFRNPNRGGGGLWNPESPSLDIDDTDGMGPENIQLDNPVNCQWYAVGVHYYREAFGTAYATIRIYINEQLVFEDLHKAMPRGNQFWDVARIHWNQGGAPGYHVFFVDDLMPAPPSGAAPRVTDEMRNSGLCALHDLY